MFPEDGSGGGGGKRGCLLSVVLIVHMRTHVENETRRSSDVILLGS